MAQPLSAIKLRVKLRLGWLATSQKLTLPCLYFMLLGKYVGQISARKNTFLRCKKRSALCTLNGPRGLDAEQGRAQAGLVAQYPETMSKHKYGGPGGVVF